MPVTVGTNETISVSVSGQSGIALAVQSGIGPTIISTGTATSVLGAMGVQPFIAGANITLTTAGGGITILAADAPVKTVNGKTGFVVISASDVTAAPEVHSHTTTQVTGLTAAIQSFANVRSVQGRTGDVVLNTFDFASPDGWIRFDNLAVTSDSDQHVKIQNNGGMVVSYDENLVFAAGDQGITINGPISFFGTPTEAASKRDATLSALGGVTSSHTHTASQISNLTTVANVVSVQGKTGAVSISRADLTAAAEVHTHATTEIVGFASHKHSTSDISNLDSYPIVRSLNEGTGSIVLAPGPNVSIQRNQNTITISAVNSGQVAAAIWPAIILGG